MKKRSTMPRITSIWYTTADGKERSGVLGDPDDTSRVQDTEQAVTGQQSIDMYGRVYTGTNSILLREDTQWFITHQDDRIEIESLKMINHDTTLTYGEIPIFSYTNRI